MQVLKIQMRQGDHCIEFIVRRNQLARFLTWLALVGVLAGVSIAWLFPWSLVLSVLAGAYCWSIMRLTMGLGIVGDRHFTILFPSHNDYASEHESNVIDVDQIDGFQLASFERGTLSAMLNARVLSLNLVTNDHKQRMLSIGPEKEMRAMVAELQTLTCRGLIDPTPSERSRNPAMSR